MLKSEKLRIISINTLEWEDDFWNSYTKNYNDIFNKEYTKEYFKNKYKMSINGFSFHSLLLNLTNEVVGACSIIPYEYSRNSVNIIVGQAVDVFILEKYRYNPMLLRDMYFSLKKVLIAHNLICVLAVPNKNVFVYWKNVVKWNHIGYLNYWVLPIKISSFFTKFSYLDMLSVLLCHILERLNYFIALISDNRREDTKFCLKDDFEFVKDRFDNSYIKIDAGFCKIYHENGVQVAYIFPVQKDWSLINLISSVKYIRKETTADIIVHIGVRNNFRFLLFRIPEKFVPLNLPITCDILDAESMSEYKDLLELSNWDYSLTNLDVR